MNKHLEPVFEVLLPELERAEIDYWVYGGISIAAFAGRFIRENTDVDIFVKEDAFENARVVLDKLCDQTNFKLTSCKPLRKTKRPKLEINIANEERLSVVPVYLRGAVVEFRFQKGSEEYAAPVLEKVERNLSGYRFFTPPDSYIKALFIGYLALRPDVKNRQKTRKDAEAILTPDEFGQIYA